MIKNIQNSSCISADYSCEILREKIPSKDLKKKLKYQTSRNTSAWKPSTSTQKERLTDGQTDMTKVMVAFHNFSYALKTNQLILYREIMAVCSEIHTKHINTLCGQNVELLNVKLVVHIVTTGL